MVLLVAKISKLYSKLENLHHQSQTEALSASFEGFQSDVLNCLNTFSSPSSKPGSEILSFSWIQQCFELIPMINKAFAKLAVEIGYPASKWEAASVDEYLKYSLNLLELFNSISSSLSHLGQARLSLSHGVSLEEKSSGLALNKLRAIQPMSFNKELVKGKVKDASCSGKEEVIHQAIMIMECIGYWVNGIVLSGLSGNDKPYSEMRKFGGGFVKFSSFTRLDSSVFEVIVKKKGELKEVKEVNEAVASLVAAIAAGKNSGEAEELRRRLEVFERHLEGFGKEVDHLFNEVLRERNQLLHGFRQLKE
ncbi:Protein BPS [Parasponia andersonii]|uniref:Protein BPS n=1 Tax=Parasponia andersonii TaxID=3476 RepID=A0A2P5DLZ9_PARAD|nr:Protein BPS [Parasponia andersonii]